MRIGLKHLFLSVLFLCLSYAGFSQHSKPRLIIDSLLGILNSYDKASNEIEPALSDSNKIKLLNKLGIQYFRLSENNNMFKNVSMANELCLKLLSIPANSNNYTLKRELAQTYHSLSNYYETTGMIPKAFENYFKALKIREEIGDLNGIAESNNNGGNLYKEQGDFSKALELYNKVLQIREGLLQKQPANKINKKGIASAYNNIGLIYNKQKKYPDALKYFFKALEIKEQLGDKLSAANSLANIGTTYCSMKNFSLSLDYSDQALKIYDDYNDKRGIASVYFNIAQSNADEALLLTGSQKTVRLNNAMRHFKKALEISQQISDVAAIKDCYQALSASSEIRKEYTEAMNYYKLFIRFRDSLNNSESMQTIVRAEVNNEFEKKAFLARQKQEVNNALQQQEHEKQKTLRNMFIVAFACMLVLAVLIFRSFRQKQKDNVIMSRQKQEVESQKALAEQKQKQIIDSINYAKRIQSSILPHDEQLHSVIPDSFIVYLPKDIVSGDFYWYYTLPNSGKILIAVADCTGHGVPGAFLSMVGSTLLNEIVIHKEITDPAQIIKELSYGLSLTLINKEEDEVDQDGMDVTICVIDPKELTLRYAAANQSIYIVNGKGVFKIDPQINSVDGIFDLNETVTLTSFEMKLEHGSCIYLLTDGYTDQVGEKVPEKFKVSRLEELFKDINPFGAEEQKAILEKTLAEWKGRTKQIDDVLILGVRV